MKFSFLEIFLIIFSQIIILFLYHIFTKKEPVKKDLFKDKLELINSILKNTKHDSIISLDRLQEIELSADKIFVFSQDIYRDIKNDGQFSNNMNNLSTFYDTVAENITNKKEYSYFLKKDANYRHSLISFFTSHSDIRNIEFCIIPSEKYFFYDEVYLYESNGEFTAYEFLPSISNEKEKRLFYLELDDIQINRLITIKDNLLRNYKESSLAEINIIKEKLEEF